MTQTQDNSTSGIPNPAETANMRWRSLLFVPALQTRFVEKAHERGADAIVLDLEDSIPQSDKAAARSKLVEAIDLLAGRNVAVLVRINRNWIDAFADIEAAIRVGVRALVLPKVAEAGAVRVVSEIMTARENENRIKAGSIGIVPMIEDAGGLLAAADIASASPRVCALTLGAEDYALATGCGTSEDAMTGPSSTIVQAASITGVVPLGLVGSIADFSDLGRFRQRVRRSRELGFRGSLLIHPRQIPAANEEFSPTQSETDWARRVLQAGAETLEHGAIQIEGQMIDLPILARARRVLLEGNAAIEEGLTRTTGGNS